MTSTATARDQRRRQLQLEAAARARAVRVRRRRRRLVGGAVAVVVVAVAAMIGVAAVRGSGSGGSGTPTGDGVPIAKMLADTPQQTISAIGLGSAQFLPFAVHDAPLTSDGKPEVLYLGADYCPFCAAERWPLVLALSRFGTFTNLGLTTSGEGEVFAGTHTFSFHDSAYRSDYISFVGRELYDNVPISRGRFHPLDKATDAEAALLAKYGNAFPIVDFGGRYVQNKASYSPGILKGMSANDIAMAVGIPQSPVAEAIGGSANALTAAICGVTGGKPAAVCTDPAIVAALSKINASSG